MANEKTPVVWDDATKKHRPLGTGEKMGGLDASSIISSDSGNLIQTGSDGLALVTGTSLADPRADNLLETSANGKLQVTIDRIVEWLDGHPSDAAVLADAMNVVSGDSGNVIVQGSDKGAYLSKAAISAAVAGMTDAQKNAIADAIAARIAGDIADGKTIVASGGKLTADPTNATAAQKKAINQALADADSGLVVDNATGKLKVDFSDMPTDKFEELLKGLKMLVPLDRNLQLYVDVTSGSDVLDDGRGAQNKPFKTIQACVNYATGTYSLGKYSIYINVGAGTYPENVSLPDYSRGSGAIHIRSSSGARDVVVEAQLSSTGLRRTCISANAGGVWHLHHIDARRVENPTTTKAAAPGCFQATSNSILHLYGCAVRQSFIDPASPVGGEFFNVRVFYMDGGGKIYLEHDPIACSITTQANAASNHPVDVFKLSRGGELWLTRAYDSDASPVTTGEVACSGSCDCFVDVGDSAVYTLGSGTLTSFTGAMTGKRYSVTAGGRISIGQGATYFPGDEAGTVDSSTYSWYA